MSSELHNGDGINLSPMPVKGQPAPLFHQPFGAREEDDGTQFIYRWLAIRRHLWKIAIFVAVTVTLITIYTLRIPKLYESTAVVRVDPSTPGVVADANNRAAEDVSTLISTQAAEVTGPAVVLSVIRSLGLQNVLPGPVPSSKPADVPDTISENLLGSVTGAIHVVRPLDTYLLEIHYRSRSPELSARIANALASELLEHEYSTRSEALLNSSRYMSRQIQELRAKMERSDLALHAFERANDIVNPQDKFKLMNDRLAAIGVEVDQERSKLRQLDSDQELVRSGNLDALLVSSRGEALKPLVESLKTAQLKLTELSAKYGLRHYLYRQAQRELAGVESSIDREQKHIATQIQSEANALATRERLSEHAFDTQKGEIDAFNAKLINYNILKQEAESDKKLYDDLLQRIKAADIEAGYHSGTLRIVGIARPQPLPVYPNIRRAVVLSFLLSLALAVLVALGVNRLDRTVTSPETVGLSLNETLLGSLPAARESTDLQALMLSARNALMRRPAFSEAVLSLRTALLLGSSERLRSICITSARPNEGKTTIAANLASAFALHGMRTLLVDGDVRRPQIHRLFDVPNRLGLTTVLQSDCHWREAIVEAPLNHLFLLPAGPIVGSAIELLAGRFGAVMEELKTNFDCVVMDSPPLLGLADTLTVSPAVDGVILIIRAGATPRESVRIALQQLHQVRAKICGVVLNNVNPNMSQIYDYYKEYYHRYYASLRPEDEETLQKRTGTH